MSAFQSHRGGNKPYNRPRGDLNGKWLHDKAPGTQNLNNPRPTGPSDLFAANTKLIVSNLHYEITPKDLTAIFGQIGTLVREPLIRYDRSGRSLGNAAVFYETSAEAAKAKKTYDGVLAKGQPMTIAFDTTPQHPRQSRRAVSAPHSLINRIQKPPLADRLSSDDLQVRDSSSGPGPTRSKPSRRGGRGTATQRSEPRSKPQRQQPKTAEELDKELDAFMGDDASPASGSGGTTAEGKSDAATTQEQDVEMA